MAVFSFCFAKSDLGNITETELKAFKEAASHVLGFSDEVLQNLVNEGKLVEVQTMKKTTKQSIAPKTKTATKAGRFKSEALGAIHELMQDAHDVGGIDKVTMRHFDSMCLAPTRAFSPDEIKAIRKKENVANLFLLSISGQCKSGEQMGAGR